jgi:hypothetical protein
MSGHFGQICTTLSRTMVIGAFARSLLSELFRTSVFNSCSKVVPLAAVGCASHGIPFREAVFDGAVQKRHWPEVKMLNFGE